MPGAEVLLWNSSANVVQTLSITGDFWNDGQEIAYC
jgi:hypothetical protein